MKSIQTKILLLILGCILLSALLVGSAGFYNARTVVENDSAQIMRLVCEQKAQEMNEPLRNIEQSVNILYQYIINQLDIDKLKENDSYCYRILQRVQEVSLNTVKNTMDSVAIYFRLSPEVSSAADGFFLVRDDTSEEYFEHALTDLSEYDAEDMEHVGWYYKPIEKERALWLEPYYNANLEKKVVSYVIPVIKDRVTVGVVGMDIDMDLLKKAINSVEVYDSGYAFLISSVGDIAYHKDYPDGLERSKFEGPLEDIKYILSKKQPGEEIYEYYDWEGQPRKMVLAKLRNEMKIAVTVPSEEIDAPERKLLRQVVLSLIVILIIAVIAAVQVTGRVVRPLKHLTAAAGRIAKGELDGVIECKSKDEVGALAESFREMAKNLNRHIEYINHLAYTDALTNSQNKTAYADRTNRIELEIKDGGVAFVVVVLDLNNLKKMNDTYGHEYGDMLIMDAAVIIQKSFGRSSVYRIGGDEFSVILDGESCENYLELVENFKQEIVRFNAGNKRYEVQLQIACGTAVFTEGLDKSFGDVFRRADQEMYQNKLFLKQKAKEAEENKA